MNLLAVFAGGLIGSGARLGIDALLPHGTAEPPWSTLIINICGALLLGFLVARVWPVAPPWVRLGLGTGVLGSFTTFSAVMVSLLTLASTAPLTGLVYLVVTLVAGFGAAALGLRLGRVRGTPPIGDDE
jgi:CrcB protein